MRFEVVSFNCKCFVQAIMMASAATTVQWMFHCTHVGFKHLGLIKDQDDNVNVHVNVNGNFDGDGEGGIVADVVW